MQTPTEREIRARRDPVRALIYAEIVTRIKHFSETFVV
jgi:hypothetical protein